MEAEAPVSSPTRIFTLTVMREADPKEPHLFPKCHRVWGYETSIEEARRKVLANHTDLFEYYYRYAVIETVPVGVPAWGEGALETEWYRAGYVDGKCVVTACPCPEEFEGAINFSMG